MSHLYTQLADPLLLESNLNTSCFPHRLYRILSTEKNIKHLTRCMTSGLANKMKNKNTTQLDQFQNE